MELEAKNNFIEYCFEIKTMMLSFSTKVNTGKSILIESSSTPFSTKWKWNTPKSKKEMLEKIHTYNNVSEIGN